MRNGGHVKAFFGATLGRSFAPIGGVGDGGADGVALPELYEADRPGEVLQATVQEDHRSKIRQTVKRLREFGRDVKLVLYATSQTVSNLDKEEDELGFELGCNIRIRDAKYFSVQINNNTSTVQAYDSYLAPSLDFLNSLGAATTISKPAPGLPARALCVFIGQEIERRSANSELLESLSDTLILWSLRDTDPAADKFLTRDEILAEIQSALPASRTFIKSVIDSRLDALSSKRNTGGRAISRWRKEQKYCLPFETRTLIKGENAEDEALKLEVAQTFKTRIEAILKDRPGVNLPIDTLVDACFRTLERVFELQGLEVSYFLTNQEDKQVRIVVDEAVSEIVRVDLVLPANKTDDARIAILRAIQGAFYDSSECERKFLNKLSRTYCLLFSLKNEPRIVEYFRGMSSNFVLYVGTDLFIRALSEHYLSKPDRMTENLFEILRAAGSTLVLTEPTLDEIWTHLKGTDFEYKNHYQGIEPSVDIEFSRHIPKILIRSYYYARLGENRDRRPNSWANYVEQFCTYSQLHKDAGRESLKNYLLEKFGCSFELKTETLAGIDETTLQSMTQELAKLRRERQGSEIRAYNDVLHALRVYQKRRELGETSKPNPFGYRTWWLTQERAVTRVTGSLVQSSGKAYIIRPEFLLNFIALNPDVEDVRRSFADIFPSLLGVRLANRMKTSAFTQIVEKMKEAYGVEEARARAKLPELVDSLKAEVRKQYDQEFDEFME